MALILALGAWGLLLLALGHVTGLAHGIEVERKRWKIRATEEEKKNEAPPPKSLASLVPGAVWRN